MLWSLLACFAIQLCMIGCRFDLPPATPPGIDASTCQASGPEVCNSVDDDCDGSTDEGFDFTSVSSCGGCGVVCSLTQRCNSTCVPLGRILFDQAHANITSYSTFRNLLTDRGYMVAITSQPIEATTLADVSVLFIATHTGSTAYAASELAAIEKAVEAGVALLLLADISDHHVPADPIAARFGVSLGADIPIVNMSVASHPITAGVSIVLRDDQAVAISSADAQPILSSTGGGFLITIPDGKTETKLGRVVVLTDLNIFADSYSGSENPMTAPSANNATLATNTIAWLTGHL